MEMEILFLQYLLSIFDITSIYIEQQYQSSIMAEYSLLPKMACFTNFFKNYFIT